MRRILGPVTVELRHGPARIGQRQIGHAVTVEWWRQGGKLLIDLEVVWMLPFRAHGVLLRVGILSPLPAREGEGS